MAGLCLDEALLLVLPVVLVVRLLEHEGVGEWLLQVREVEGEDGKSKSM